MPDKMEAERSMLGSECNYYSEDLQESKLSREAAQKARWLIKADEMPWDDSPQGRIKHIVHEKMNTKEPCIDTYQQVIPPGSRSGKHRHMEEEILFVLEGKGYDLHWDVSFDCTEEKYKWDWAKEPKRFDWAEGDFVYIPPFTAHQHFNADKNKPARFISVSNRVVKQIGFNWLEQLENAPEYKGK